MHAREGTVEEIASNITFNDKTTSTVNMFKEVTVFKKYEFVPTTQYSSTL